MQSLSLSSWLVPLVAQLVSSLLLGSTWVFSLGGWVLAVLGWGWKVEESRECAFTWWLLWWPSAKGPCALIFLWEMLDFFFSLSSLALCRASILLLYSESTGLCLIYSH